MKHNSFEAICQRTGQALLDKITREDLPEGNLITLVKKILQEEDPETGDKWGVTVNYVDETTKITLYPPPAEIVLNVVI